MQALSGRGARYIEKKARREVSKFVIWSRILRAVAAKKPDGVGLFWPRDAEVGEQCSRRNQKAKILAKEILACFVSPLTLA
jgi:hypothetical protein